MRPQDVCRASLAALVATSLAACGDSDPAAPETDPCQVAPGIRAEMESTYGGAWTPDHEFALAARVLPGGFGGLYWDDYEARRLAIVLVDLSQAEQMKAAFVAALSCGVLFAKWERVHSLSTAHIVVKQGQYDALQLFEWKLAAGGVFADPAAISLHMDEGRNRIVVGITDEASRERVEDLLVALGIPREAFIVEVTGPIGWPMRSETPGPVGASGTWSRRRRFA